MELFDQPIVDAAIDQWRWRVSACPSERHFPADKQAEVLTISNDHHTIINERISNKQNGGQTNII